jgi:predicted RNA binding protein YcfA (HicA-like mRNA interferase family)
MKLPRDLSGVDLIKVLCKHFGYAPINQQGSHVILETTEPRQHRISVPEHSPLRVGTLNSILRAIATAKGVEREDILSFL